MTPERLDQIERHFRNPPSSSCNALWALELVAEIRRLSGPLSIPEAVERILPAPISDVRTLVDTQHYGGASDAAPTPPVIDDRPATKKKKGAK